MIVQNADGAGKAELPRAPSHGDRVLGIWNASAQNGVDGNPEVSVSRQPLEFQVQHLQALFGNTVGHDVVYADLQIVQASVIEGFDPGESEQQAVGNQSSDGVTLTNAANDGIQIGMQRRLAAAQ